MSSGKWIVIAGAAAGLAALLLGSKKSSAASSNLPPGWTPPSGAVFSSTPPGAVPLTQDRWQWRNETQGGAPGTMVLLTNHANPTADFVAYLLPDGQGGTPAILAVGQTPNSGLMAQAAMAGL
jgi:hypothetical protein